MVFFSRKKRSHHLKLYLYQIGKAQNMPVVAGRLVYYYFLNEHIDQSIFHTYPGDKNVQLAS